MIVIGLTGGIATGKSVLASQFEACGVKVFNADACVHQLLGPNGTAVAAVEKAFPSAVIKGAVDRAALGKIVFADDAKLGALEAILHPFVRAAEIAFVMSQAKQRKRACVLEIPLLFETGADVLCDIVVTTYCPAFLQEQRALKRPNMTPEKLKSILYKQMKQPERARLADIVIPTSLGKSVSFQSVRLLLQWVHHA